MASGSQAGLQFIASFDINSLDDPPVCWRKCHKASETGKPTNERSETGIAPVRALAAVAALLSIWLIPIIGLRARAQGDAPTSMSAAPVVADFPCHAIKISISTNFPFEGVHKYEIYSQQHNSSQSACLLSELTNKHLRHERPINNLIIGGDFLNSGLFCRDCAINRTVPSRPTRFLHN